MEQFKSFEDISVRLIAYTPQPYEIGVGSARTCYSGSGVIFPDQVSKNEKAIALRDRIAESTREAGHLTTRQHAHFVFALSGVSRNFIWSFLHSHPFYNSEQVSQRYVKVKRDGFLLPPLEGTARELAVACASQQMAAYQELIEVLKEPLAQDFWLRFPARRKQPEKWASAIEKRAMEVARYVLGIGTTAYLYHTVNALTLLRYSRLMEHFDTPQEQQIVVRKMVEAVLAIDPLFAKELSDPLPLDRAPEYAHFGERPTFANPKFAEEFDRGLEGRASRLVGYHPKSTEILAGSVRLALGKTEGELSKAEALALVLDPQRNALLGDTLHPMTLDKLGQALHHVPLTFQKKLSHTADSQDQRHRMVFASRPFLKLCVLEKPDFITPFGITQSTAAMEIYHRSMERSFETVAQLLDSGVSFEKASYFLPNALSIRFFSTGDLLALQHKWRLRLCYNAQEEIFRASRDEVLQVEHALPDLKAFFRAPCSLRNRAQVKPYCPEGDRFCGLPVWKYGIEQYQRKSL